MDIPDTVEFHDVLNHVIDWQDEKKIGISPRELARLEIFNDNV